MALLRTRRDSTGLAVLLVEQNARSALSIADAGVVMTLGRLKPIRADDDIRTAYLGL
jgi:branched-chain amino acid transport system ATP-binding protein